MIQVNYDYTIPAPVGTVSNILSNPLLDPEWQAACRYTEAIPSGNVVRWRDRVMYRIHYDFAGQSAEFLCEADHTQLPFQFGYRSLQGPFNYRGHYLLQPTGHQDGQEHCYIQWQFLFEAGSFWGVIPPVVLKKMILAQYKEDTQRLTTLVLQGIA